MANVAEPGRVECIHVAVSEGEPMRATDRIRVLAGIGLEGVVAKSLLDPLSHRSGLRADVLEDGEIRIGDELRPLEG